MVGDIGMDGTFMSGEGSSLLADLPEDVLERVMSGAAGRAVASAACACRRLKSTKVWIGMSIMQCVGAVPVLSMHGC